MGLGEGLTLAAALIYALHILTLSAYSTSENAVGLAVAQIATTALVCVAAALTIQGRITLPHSRFDWAAIIYIAPWAPGLGLVVHRVRTSGKIFRTPVNVFVRRGEYVFALTYGLESDCVKNVQSASGCELQTRRRTVI